MASNNFELCLAFSCPVPSERKREQRPEFSNKICDENPVY